MSDSKKSATEGSLPEQPGSWSTGLTRYLPSWIRPPTGHEQVGGESSTMGSNSEPPLADQVAIPDPPSPLHEQHLNSHSRVVVAELSAHVAVSEPTQKQSPSPPTHAISSPIVPPTGGFFSAFFHRDVLGSIRIRIRTRNGKDFSFDVKDKTALYESIQQEIGSELEKSALDRDDIESTQLIDELRRISEIPIDSPLRKQTADRDDHLSSLRVRIIARAILEIEVKPNPPFDLFFDKWSPFLGSLTNIKTLVLEGHELVNIDSSIGGLTRVESLIIPKNKIRSLPPEIGSLDRLRVLNLDGNSISYFPDTIGNLTSLQSISASKNGLRALPPTISNLACLRTLDLSSNLLNTLPLLEPLTALEDLDLSHNAIKTPFLKPKEYLTELKGLRSLKKLNLSENLLTTLPSSLGTLAALEELSIANNGLTALAFSEGELSTLTSVRRLVLTHNKITSVHPSINGMNSLSELVLNENSLSELPATFAAMENLTMLDLSRNEFKAFPTPICGLSHLKFLFITNNSIPSLPPEIGSLTCLEALDLSHNQLTELPDSFGASLSRLGVLDLSTNKLTSLPESLSLLPSLRFLRLHSNDDLTSLCFTERHLTTLETLTIGNVAVEVKRDSILAAPVDSSLPASSSILKLANQTSHILLSRAVCFVAQALNDIDVVIDQNGLSHLIYLINSNSSLKAIALEAIEKLLQTPSNRQKLVTKHESLIQALVSTLVETSPEAEQTHALLALSHLAFNEQLKKPVFDAVLPYKVGRLLTHETSKLRDAARRLLIAIGSTDDIHPIPEGRAPRVLALDGGGVRGLVTLHILRKIEELTGKSIVELFDLIIGTSTGSIIAVLLGVKHYSVEDALSIYSDLAKRSFVSHAETPTPLSPTPARVLSPPTRKLSAEKIVTLPLKERAEILGEKQEENVKEIVKEEMKASPAKGSSWWNIFNYTGFISKGTWYQTRAYEDLIKEYAGEELFIDAALNSHPFICCVGALMTVNPLQPFVFRSFQHPPSSKVRTLGLTDIPVWAAVRASTSAPGYFEIYERDGQAFRDGGMIANNPSALALHEAKTLWPNHPLPVVVSVGTGRCPIFPVQQADRYSQLLSQVMNSCAETEETHHVLTDLMPPNRYYRLQPVHEIFSVGLDETSPEKLEMLKEQTLAWINESHDVLEDLAQTLGSSG